MEHAAPAAPASAAPAYGGPAGLLSHQPVESTANPTPQHSTGPASSPSNTVRLNSWNSWAVRSSRCFLKADADCGRSAAAPCCCEVVAGAACCWLDVRGGAAARDPGCCCRGGAAPAPLPGLVPPSEGMAAKKGGSARSAAAGSSSSRSSAPSRSPSLSLSTTRLQTTGEGCAVGHSAGRARNRPCSRGHASAGAQPPPS